MYIHIENWVHGQEDHFLKKYSDDFFFRGLYNSEDIMPEHRKNISKQDIINVLKDIKKSRIPFMVNTGQVITKQMLDLTKILNYSVHIHRNWLKS